MKAGWQTKKLGEILDIQNGFAFNSKEFSADGEMPLIRIRDLKVGTTTETRFSGEYDKKYLVRKGDFLIGMDGEFGCFEWKGEPALLNQRVCRLQNFGSDILPRFLFYGVNSHLKEIEDATSFTTVKHLSSRQIQGIDFILPPLPTQRRIVGFLDEAFEGIAKVGANAEANLNNARHLFESHLNAIFSTPGPDWEKKSLGQIADVKGGKRVPKGYKLQEAKTDHPYITVSDFNDDGSIDIDGIRYISKEVFEQIRRYTITSNDLYISIAGTIGKTGLIPEELNGANLTENACKLVFHDKIEPKFVYYFTRTKGFKDQAGLNTRVAAQPKLALERLKTISLFIPQQNEQQKAIAQWDSLAAETKRLEAIYQQKLALLAELKQSLLHKAFSGEL